MRAAPWALMAALALAGCRDAPAPAPLAPVGAAATEAARTACARGGGSLRPAAAGGALVCLRDTRDAGRACSRATDCEGACLARSRTCAPFTPLFGCNEILLADGRAVTECRE
jgi:hypothetical protein